jgi:predicted MFS family arabinose efflux permease
VNRLGPLREPQFRLLFSGQVISLAGSAMAPIALAFAVLGIGSPSDLGLVLASSWIPQIVFILVGGVWADRLPRHLVMTAANLLSGAAQAGVAVLLLLHVTQLWQLIALQVVRGIAISFFFPASQGVVPHIVEPDHLQQANALLRLSQNGTSIIGAAVGGGLVAAIGSGWAIAFDAATFFASAAVLARMRLPLSERAERAGFIRELAEGWKEFRSRTWLWLIVVAAGVGNMVWVGGQAVLGPVVARSSLGGAAGWGIVVAAEAVGLVGAGVVALRWRPKRLLVWGVIGLLAGPPFLASLAAPLPLAAVALVAVASGFGIEFFSVYWVTALQQHIADEVLARVNSYDALGSFVFIPIGLTLAGPVADSIGVSNTLWVAAAVNVAMVLTMLASGDVRSLRRREAKPTTAPLETEPLPPPIRSA